MEVSTKGGTLHAQEMCAEGGIKKEASEVSEIMTTPPSD